MSKKDKKIIRYTNREFNTIKEGLDPSVFKPNKYSRVNEVITEILCNNGQCPII